MGQRPRPLHTFRRRAPPSTETVVLDSFAKPLNTTVFRPTTLTDNGMVITTRLSGGKGGRMRPESTPGPTRDDWATSGGGVRRQVISSQVMSVR